MKKIEKVKLKEVNFKKLKWNTIIGLYLEYKEIINYLVFGVLATIVNFISYFLFAKVLKIEEVTSSMLSWFCAVLFAYVTNKIFVFDSKTNTMKEFLKEMFSFFLARILSGILCDVGSFAFMVKILQINDVVAKLVTQVMVVIVNYVLSRWVVFRGKQK